MPTPNPEELWLNHSTVFNDGQRGVPDGDFQEAIDEAIEQAAQANQQTIKAAQYLMHEVSALKAFGPEVAEIIGYTNWNCLQRRREELDAALANSVTKVKL